MSDMPIMKTLMGYEICDEVARTTKADTVHTHSADDIIDGVVPVEKGGTGAITAVEALHNLGIHWGFEDAETYWGNIENGDELKKNTIYIQIN